MKQFLKISVRAIQWILIAVVLLIIGITIFFNTNYFDQYIKSQIEQKLARALNRQITVDQVAFNPFLFSIRLQGFTIGNDPRSSEVPFFHGREIYIRVSWRHLFAGRVRISQVKLIRPELYVIFYDGGGNNWPTIKRKEEKKKGRGLDLIIRQVDCDNMLIVYNNHRIPLTFSVTDLETYVEYDRKQNNYLAETSFKDGKLKIRDFEIWKFDLESTYRIIGGRVSFEKLHLLSDRSRFYMAGEMYNLENPFFDFRFRSHINLDQTREMFHFGLQMSGRGSYRAIYKGTFTRFRMQGHGQFRRFTFFHFPVDHATFDLDMTDNWLSVSNIKARMFEGSYTGDFSIAPLKGHSIFRTSATLNNWDGKTLGKWIRMQDIILPVRLSGSAQMTWEEGGFKDLDGTFRFQIQPYEKALYDLVTVAEESNFDNTLYRNPFFLPFSSESQFRIHHRRLQDIHSDLKLPYTAITASGTIDFSGKADLDIVTHTEKIPEVDLLFHYLQAYFKGRPSRDQEFWRVKGVADFTGKLDATVWKPFQPRLTGEVRGKNVFYHGVQLDQVRADVLFHQRLIQVFDSDMYRDGGTVTAVAKFLLSDEKRGIPTSMDLTGEIRNFPSTEISHAFLLELPIYSRVDATIRLKGPLEELEGRSDFQASTGQMWGEKWDRASGTILFFPDSLGLRNISAFVNAGYAEASGDLVYENDSYTVRFIARNIPLERLNVLQQNGIEMFGLATVEGSGEGTLRKPALKGNIKINNLIYKKEFYGDIDSKVNLAQGKLKLDASAISHGVPSQITAELDLEGNLPFGANFQIVKFPVEILIRAYDPEIRDITGLVGGNFEMTGTLRPAGIHHLAGALQSIQLTAFGITLQEARPLQILLQDKVIEVSDCVLTGEHTTISLEGKIYPQQKGRLDLTLSSQIGLGILSTRDRNIFAEGTSTARINVGGTFAQPTLTGVMEIKDGFFRHDSFPNSLTDIQALVTFKNNNITLQSLKANSSGGSLTAGGSATLSGYGFSSFRFDLYANHIRVHYPQGLRSTVDAELHLQKEKVTTYLVGNIQVLEGVFTRSFEESPTLFRYARVPAFTAIGGTSLPGSETLLNIHIQSENLLVRNNFANAQTSANLKLVGTIDNPVLVGRMDVTKGTVTFRDREYRVVRGSLDFQNPYQTEAQMNFVAETKVLEYNITLTFSGTFDRIYHDLSSDPPLPRDEIYVLLGIGRLSIPYGGTGQSGEQARDISAVIAGQQISEFIASPITSPLEREFKRVLGLQRLQISPVFFGQSSRVATARITLQKDISTDFSVTYSTNLFTAAEEIILLQYRLTDEIQVTASKDERARYGIDVLVTKSFE